MELRASALRAFQEQSPEHKVRLTLDLHPSQNPLLADPSASFPTSMPPGTPDRPALVDPKEVPKRSPFTATGHAALMHSIAHIEFNAINLALDCIWRYPHMPQQFYKDWAQVAAEEAKHFALLSEHLRALGFAYGDFQAHTGLWTMCNNTAHDLVARMALVPRTMEARGLDATPLVQAKLIRVGTPAALAAKAILDVILADEIGHVATGNKWYRQLCHERGLDVNAFYAYAADHYNAPRLKPPFNHRARRAAGFTPDELAQLNYQAGLPSDRGAAPKVPLK